MARILYADDDADLRESFTRVIAGLGHTIITVDDAVLAWGLLKKEEQFDLIISDFNMRDMDGLTFLAHVKSDPRIAEVPFALISGYHSSTLVDKCTEMGGRFFSKENLSIPNLIKELLPPSAPKL